jgi:hypothetical protein
MDTDELERLAAVCQTVKGRHDLDEDEEPR